MQSTSHKQQPNLRCHKYVEEMFSNDVKRLDDYTSAPFILPKSIYSELQTFCAFGMYKDGEPSAIAACPNHSLEAMNEMLKNFCAAKSTVERKNIQIVIFEQT